ncbi:MAG: LysM peptidoglycan-binding domain-containing protein [Actinomycetota bacterium]
MRTPTPGPVIIALVAALAGATLFATTSVTVAEGDTLTSIAARYGVSTAELVEWNDIEDPDRIYVGDILLLAAPSTGPASDGPIQHVVSAGDTLTVIAARYGATVAAIAEANELDDVDYIRIGQRLAVGGPSPTDATTSDTTADADPASTTTEHTVAPGETLFSIAARYGRSVGAIATANEIVDTDRIRVGDVLVIPDADTDTPDDEPDAPSPSEDDTESEESPAPDGDAESDEAPASEDDSASDEPTSPEDEAATDEPAEEPSDGGTDSDDAPTRGAAPDPAASAADLADAFELWSLSYGVEQPLLEAITWYASDWDPTRAGLDGRVGIAQLTPAQVELVETRLLGRDLDPFDGPDGVRLAARYLRYVLDRTHSETEALMAFRQGLDGFLAAGPTADAEAFALAVQDIRDQRS